jgi:hypothetical protein
VRGSPTPHRLLPSACHCWTPPSNNPRHCWTAPGRVPGVLSNNPPDSWTPLSNNSCPASQFVRGSPQVVRGSPTPSRARVSASCARVSDPAPHGSHPPNLHFAFCILQFAFCNNSAPSQCARPQCHLTFAPGASTHKKSPPPNRQVQRRAPRDTLTSRREKPQRFRLLRYSFCAPSFYKIAPLFQSQELNIAASSPAGSSPLLARSQLRQYEALYAGEFRKPPIEGDQFQVAGECGQVGIVPDVG